MQRYLKETPFGRATMVDEVVERKWFDHRNPEFKQKNELEKYKHASPTTMRNHITRNLKEKYNCVTPGPKPESFRIDQEALLDQKN